MIGISAATRHPAEDRHESNSGAMVGQPQRRLAPIFDPARYRKQSAVTAEHTTAVADDEMGTASIQAAVAKEKGLNTLALRSQPASPISIASEPCDREVTRSPSSALITPADRQTPMSAPQTRNNSPTKEEKVIRTCVVAIPACATADPELNAEDDFRDASLPSFFFVSSSLSGSCNAAPTRHHRLAGYLRGEAGRQPFRLLTDYYLGVLALKTALENGDAAAQSYQAYEERVRKSHTAHPRSLPKRASIGAERPDARRFGSNGLPHRLEHQALQDQHEVSAEMAAEDRCPMDDGLPAGAHSGGGVFLSEEKSLALGRPLIPLMPTARMMEHAPFVIKAPASPADYANAQHELQTLLEQENQHFIEDDLLHWQVRWRLAYQLQRQQVEASGSSSPTASSTAAAASKAFESDDNTEDTLLQRMAKPKIGRPRKSALTFVVPKETNGDPFSQNQTEEGNVLAADDVHARGRGRGQKAKSYKAFFPTDMHGDPTDMDGDGASPDGSKDRKEVLDPSFSSELPLRKQRVTDSDVSDSDGNLSSTTLRKAEKKRKRSMSRAKSPLSPRPIKLKLSSNSSHLPMTTRPTTPAWPDFFMYVPPKDRADTRASEFTRERDMAWIPFQYTELTSAPIRVPTYWIAKEEDQIPSTVDVHAEEEELQAIDNDFADPIFRRLHSLPERREKQIKTRHIEKMRWENYRAEQLAQAARQKAVNQQWCVSLDVKKQEKQADIFLNYSGDRPNCLSRIETYGKCLQQSPAHDTLQRLLAFQANPDLFAPFVPTPMVPVVTHDGNLSKKKASSVAKAEGRPRDHSDTDDDEDAMHAMGHPIRKFKLNTGRQPPSHEEDEKKKKKKKNKKMKKRSQDDDDSFSDASDMSDTAAVELADAKRRDAARKAWLEDPVWLAHFFGKDVQMVFPTDAPIKTFILPQRTIAVGRRLKGELVLPSPSQPMPQPLQIPPAATPLPPRHAHLKAIEAHQKQMQKPTIATPPARLTKRQKALEEKREYDAEIEALVDAEMEKYNAEKAAAKAAKAAKVLEEQKAFALAGPNPKDASQTSTLSDAAPSRQIEHEEGTEMQVSRSRSAASSTPSRASQEAENALSRSIDDTSSEQKASMLHTDIRSEQHTNGDAQTNIRLEAANHPDPRLPRKASPTSNAEDNGATEDIQDHQHHLHVPVLVAGVPTTASAAPVEDEFMEMDDEMMKAIDDTLEAQTPTNGDIEMTTVHG